jgi:hypothetical protein
MSIETTLTLLVAALILVIAVSLRTIVVGTLWAIRSVARRLRAEVPETRRTTPRPQVAPLLKSIGSLAQFALAHLVGAATTVASVVGRFGREKGIPAYRTASRSLRSSLSVDAFADPLTGPLLLDETEGQTETRAAYRSRTGAHPSA